MSDVAKYQSMESTPSTWYKFWANRLLTSLDVIASMMFDDGLGWEGGALIALHAAHTPGDDFNSDLIAYSLLTGFGNSIAVSLSYIVIQLIKPWLAKCCLKRTLPPPERAVLAANSLLIASATTFSGASWQPAFVVMTKALQADFYTSAICTGTASGLTFFIMMQLFRTAANAYGAEHIDKAADKRGEDFYIGARNAAANTFFTALAPTGRFANVAVAVHAAENDYIGLMIYAGLLALGGATCLSLVIDTVLATVDYYQQQTASRQDNPDQNPSML